MSTPTFDKVDKKIVLVNTFTHAWKHWRNVPLWGMIADICGLGSNSSIELCKELDLNPYAMVNQQNIRAATTTLHTKTHLPPPPAPDPATNPNWDW